MLKGSVIHPQILAAVGRAGHGSKILIADGNYPFCTRRGPNAELVFLNLSPGKLNVTDVLESLLTIVPVEEAVVMAPNRTGPYAMKTDPLIFAEFIKLLKKSTSDLDLKKVDRFAFYDLASTSETCLTIATGEQRIYANLLLTIGVVK